MRLRNEAIANRHSSRSFRPDPIPEEDLEAIVLAACAAPSHKNLQAWHLLLLEGEDLHAFADRLSDHFSSDGYTGPRPGPIASMGAMRQAPACIFVFSDEDPASILHNSAVQSVGAAIENMLIEAETRGIASLWCCDILYAYDLSMELLDGSGELMAAVILGYEGEPTPRKTHKTPSQVLERFADHRYYIAIRRFIVWSIWLIMTFWTSTLTSFSASMPPAACTRSSTW